jgi:hypothetical protein
MTGSWYNDAQVAGNILSGYEIVIPAGFWRESMTAQWLEGRVAGFPPKARGNDGKRLR